MVKNGDSTTSEPLSAFWEEKMANQDKTLEELKRIRIRMDQIQNHWLLTSHENFWKFLGVSILRGLAVGFGTAIGATIVVS